MDKPWRKLPRGSRPAKGHEQEPDSTKGDKSPSCLPELMQEWRRGAWRRAAWWRQVRSWTCPPGLRSTPLSGILPREPWHEGLRIQTPRRISWLPECSMTRTTRTASAKAVRRFGGSAVPLWRRSQPTPPVQGKELQQQRKPPSRMFQYLIPSRVRPVSSRERKLGQEAGRQKQREAPDPSHPLLSALKAKQGGRWWQKEHACLGGPPLTGARPFPYPDSRVARL